MNEGYYSINMNICQPCPSLKKFLNTALYVRPYVYRIMVLCVCGGGGGGGGDLPVRGGGGGEGVHHAAMKGTASSCCTVDYFTK